MTRKEKISKDIHLTFEFLRQVVDNPKILDKIPDGSVLEFVEDDFPQKEKASKKAKAKTANRKFLRVRSHFEVLK
jgi:hypothetical protein